MCRSMVDIQSPTAEIRRGKKKKKIEDGKKLQDENIYGLPITYGDHKNEFKHSEMGPVRQNPMQRTVGLFICVCIALWTIVAHNIAQNRPDNFPSYPPDNHRCSDDVYLMEGGEY